METIEPKATDQSAMDTSQAETATLPNATRTALAEVNDNVTSSGHKDTTKTEKDVARDGDNDLIDSDDENQGVDPGDQILQNLANAEPKKKKKKKKKSGKKGSVVLRCHIVAHAMTDDT